MKKLLFIFFLFLIVIYKNPGNNEEYVFNEIINEKGKYCISVLNGNLNTKNIDRITNNYNIKIISLYPYIPEIYKNILGNSLNFVNYDNGYNNFSNYYYSLLKQIGMNNEIYMERYNGIKFEKMIVYGSYHDIEKFIKDFKYVKCSI